MATHETAATAAPKLGPAIRRALSSPPAADAAPPQARNKRAARGPRSNADRREREADRRRMAAERAAALLRSDALLRLREVLALVPVSPSTWWLGVREGRFPAGLKLGARCTAWPAATIRELLARLEVEGER